MMLPDVLRLRHQLSSIQTDIVVIVINMALSGGRIETILRSVPGQQPKVVDRVSMQAGPFSRAE